FKQRSRSGQRFVPAQLRLPRRASPYSVVTAPPERRFTAVLLPFPRKSSPCPVVTTTALRCTAAPAVHRPNAFALPRCSRNLMRKRDRPGFLDRSLHREHEVQRRIHVGQLRTLDQTVENGCRVGACLRPRAVVILAPKDDAS